MLLAVSKGAGPAGALLVQAFTLRWAPLTEVDSPPDAMSLMIPFQGGVYVVCPCSPTPCSVRRYRLVQAHLHPAAQALVQPESPGPGDADRVCGPPTCSPFHEPMSPGCCATPAPSDCCGNKCFLYSELGCEFCAHDDKRASLTGTVSSSAVVSSHLEDSLQVSARRWMYRCSQLLMLVESYVVVWGVSEAVSLL